MPNRATNKKLSRREATELILVPTSIIYLFQVFYIIFTRGFSEDGLTLYQRVCVECGDAVSSDRAIVLITSFFAT